MLHHLRIITATLIICALAPLLYLGKTVCGPLEEGADYEIS